MARPAAAAPAGWLLGGCGTTPGGLDGEAENAVVLQQNQGNPSESNLTWLRKLWLAMQQ